MKTRCVLVLAAALWGPMADAPAASEPGLAPTNEFRWESGTGTGASTGAWRPAPVAMSNRVDPKYARLSNPLPRTAANVSRGRQLYVHNCAGCHGSDGLGDGPAAKRLRPPPGNLAALLRLPLVSDAYLNWTVAEGGVPVGSAMPPFKDVLKPDDIWRVILFLQTL